MITEAEKAHMDKVLKQILDRIQLFTVEGF